jgi:hypothetical protein
MKADLQISIKEYHGNSTRISLMRAWEQMSGVLARSFCRWINLEARAVRAFHPELFQSSAVLRCFILNHFGVPRRPDVP